MSSRYILGALVAALVAGSASAQFNPQQPATQNPAISPYLNLLRRNSPAYMNYYGLVQPQIQAQNTINTLQQQVTGLQNASINNSIPGTGSELYTGKYVGHFTHRGYFMNSYGNGQQSGVGGVQGTGGQIMGSNPYNAQQGANTVQPPIISNNSIMPFRK